MITDKDIKQATAYINGVDIYDVGALVESFKVSATAISSKIYQGLDSTDFHVLSTTRSMRTITLTLFYQAKTKRDLALKKAKIDNAIGAGKIDLVLPDGFHYSAYLTKAGDEEYLGVEGNKMIALCTYQLKGIRHDDLKVIETSSGSVFNCESLIPQTDVRISHKTTQAYQTITIAGVTITGVASGDVLTIDGINKRILQNGAPCAGNMSFVSFPKLVPGDNSITCKIGTTTAIGKLLTVEYYPTY